jgi:selenide,water dikinase
VTGFGLLGHLIEMVRASDVDITVVPDHVPLLEGARKTVAAGIFSSLQPQNVRLRRAIKDVDLASKHPLYPLLFDPQTAGGLLASVPCAEAQNCIAELRAAGYEQASVIGTVSPRGSVLEPVSIEWGERAHTTAQASPIDTQKAARSTPEQAHAEESVH